MPRTFEKTVFTINELSDDAKETAHNQYLGSGFEYFWIDEAVDTLKAFCDIFPIDLDNYGLGSYQSHIETSFNDDDIANLSGVRLMAYIWNNQGRDIWKNAYKKSLRMRDENEPILTHPKLRSRLIKTGPNAGKRSYSYYTLKRESSCPLTGVCYDEDILQPIHDFMAAPSDSVTFEGLISDCCDALIKSIEAECESQETMEYFVDHAAANEYEFDIDGARC